MTAQQHDTEVADFTVAFDRHPDIIELTKTVNDVVLKKAGPTATVSGMIQERRMVKTRRRIIGVYLVVLGVALLSAAPWLWSEAARVVAQPAGATITTSIFGIGFTMSADFALVTIVVLMAMLGSLAVLALTFSSRSGHETLERGYFWWYLTRPLSGAAVGLLFYLTLVAGFFGAGTVDGRPALVVAGSVGGLAGLFTDQVLQKMRGILGQLPTNQQASGKSDDTNK